MPTNYLPTHPAFGQGGDAVIRPADCQHACDVSGATPAQLRNANAQEDTNA